MIRRNPVHRLLVPATPPGAFAVLAVLAVLVVTVAVAVTSSRDSTPRAMAEEETATFQATVSPTGCGTVQAQDTWDDDPATEATSWTFLKNALVWFQAYPVQGCTFNRWTLVLDGREYSSVTNPETRLVVSEASVTAHFTGTPGAPAAPTGFTATAGNTQIALTWSNPSDSTLTKYQVRVKPGLRAWQSWADISGSSASTTSHTLTGLTNDVEYTVELRAVRGSSTGASASTRATPVPPAPPAPSGFTVFKADGSVILTWDDPRDSTISVYGYRQKAAGGSWSVWKEVSVSSNFRFQIFGLTNGTTYTFELWARRGLYATGPSVSGTATPMDLTPLAPSQLRGSGEDGQIKWTWLYQDPPIDQLQYRLSDDNGTTWFPSWNDLPGNSASSTSFVLAGLINDTEYRFELRAIRGVHIGRATFVYASPRASQPATSVPDRTHPQVARDTTTTPPATVPPPGVAPPPSVAPPPGVVLPPAGGAVSASSPLPSTADFAWTVQHDIDALHAAHSDPTGTWGDGETLWIAQDGLGAGSAVFAYELATGARAEERDLALGAGSRDPRGIWSDGETMWVSDSDRGRLAAYDLASGVRAEERDMELHRRNADARGVWLDGATWWVLDGGRDSLFAYHAAGGALIAEYALAAADSDPGGIWADGVTVWVSDLGAKRLFAYRLPEPRAAEDGERVPLQRVRSEEFATPGQVGNNSPYGMWSDGDVMYVVDVHDGRVYSYNMPDAIDARLASLDFGDVDIGEFSPAVTGYRGSASGGATTTTITATAAQPGATVVIEPPDAAARTAGHQVALDDLFTVTVTVTSGDGTRTRVYRLRVGDPPCMRGSVAVGFSLVVHSGGSVDDLDACARNRSITALYTLHQGAYVSYIPGAPDFVNRPFRELFTDGVPALTPLIVDSDGPPLPDAGGAVDAGLPWPGCLRGAVAEGFSAVVYGGGSVDDLVACASTHNVTALYVLHEGDWVSYVPGATPLVNRSFAELFADGVPAVTPLIVKSEGP